MADLALFWSSVVVLVIYFIVNAIAYKTGKQGKIVALVIDFVLLALLIINVLYRTVVFS